MQKHTTWRDELDPIDTGMEDKTVEVYHASDVDARITELESTMARLNWEHQSIEGMQRDRQAKLEKALRGFVEFQISDYDRMSDAAKRYCELRRAARSLMER